jgi:septum formation protein
LGVDSTLESSPNAPVPQPPPLILASTSVYRRELLERLRLPFSVESPGVDEAAPDDEPAGELALRLAHAKAGAVAARNPGSLVLGSDQVAQLGRQRLGKPGSRANAIAQLEACSGLTVEFATAVCLHDARDGTDRSHLDRTRVKFRRLTTGEIERYVDADQPLDCAGGFRCEALGISLFAAIESQDPTALIGLPMIHTARLLREVGLLIP